MQRNPQSFRIRRQMKRLPPQFRPAPAPLRNPSPPPAPKKEEKGPPEPPKSSQDELPASEETSKQPGPEPQTKKE